MMYKIINFINRKTRSISWRIQEYMEESSCIAHFSETDYWGETEDFCLLHHGLECGRHIICYCPKIVKNRCIEKYQKEIEEAAEDL